VALAIRTPYAHTRAAPVSADAAYYLMVADNLYQGRGLVSDYVWNYLAGLPEGLPVPSNDYWMPGASAVTALAFTIAGDTSLRVAQWPALIFGALLCAITAWIAGAISQRHTAAALAGLAAAVNYYLVELSIQPDHFMLNAVLVNLSLLALWAAWRGSAWIALPAGALAGLAYLTRSDAALLPIAAILLVVLTRRRARRYHGIRVVTYFLAAMVMVAFPWCVRQALVFGHPFGAGPLRTAFLTSYNDLFRLDQSQLNLGDYLQTSQVVAWGLKAYLLGVFLRILAKALLLVGALALAALAVKDLRRESAPWLIYLVLGLLVPPLLVPYPAGKGGFWHLMPALIPGIIALGAVAAVRAVEASRARPAQTPPGSAGSSAGRKEGFSLQALTARGHPAITAAAALAALVGFGSLFYWWVIPPPDAAREPKPLYPAVAADAVQALGPNPAPALTDHAWGLYYVARIPCAQFPSDGADAALQVADAIGARYLITRADAPDTIHAMQEVIGHPRFRPLTRYPAGETSLLVYRILPATPPPRVGATR
jgi:hypothetical protein